MADTIYGIELREKSARSRQGSIMPEHHEKSRSRQGSSFVERPVSQPAMGSYIYVLALMAGLGGFLFGYDTGVVSSAMLYVPLNSDLAPVSNEWQELIVAITSGLAGVGALAGAQLGDAYGRRNCILLSSLSFAAGALVCGFGFSKWILLAGRMLLGLAIGLASTIIPIYVGESSPASIRGKLISLFSLMITFGLMSANIMAEAFSFVDPVRVGWRLMFAFAVVPSLVQFVGFLWLPESPRWLYRYHGVEECKRVLAKIYNGDENWVRYEVVEIEEAHREQEAAERDGSRSIVSLLSRISSTPPIRRALFLGCAAQIYQQFSGINTIMYYTGTIIRSTGVRDYHMVIALSIITSAVNCLCTLVPMHLVERVGRRPLLLGSMAGTVASLCLMGGAFLAINLESASTMSEAILLNNQPNKLSSSNSAKTTIKNEFSGLSWHQCLWHSNCDYCVMDEYCGFCPLPDKPTEAEEAGSKYGLCVPRQAAHGPHSPSAQCTSIARNLLLPMVSPLQMDTLPPESSNITHLLLTISIDNTTTLYMEESCQTRFLALPIVIMVLYLCCYSIGLGTLPWVLNAEFYPLWARSTCVSLATFTNWSANLLIALTFLSLGQLLTKFGVFFLYAAITTTGLVIFARMLPETKGQSIDEVQHLFAR